MKPVRVEGGPVNIGFGWVKAKERVEHISVHTVRVTYTTDTRML